MNSSPAVNSLSARLKAWLAPAAGLTRSAPKSPIRTCLWGSVPLS